MKSLRGKEAIRIQKDINTSSIARINKVKENKCEYGELKAGQNKVNIAESKKVANV
ncbi:hypothetical protein OQH61_06980 [Helicobacter sp. MIT 21-1697]|uniref:hypothetical protein n=1 Tax=Helicobacter sp. MIT 21-1697 TaxID=2993733 RepID=UPI00224A6870|nr:hypothetical protein [Helicobacter sp. MIT 21-1697]MCX2717474.1 hypothetical protein [Helicobacter sp. MIT 21-1697]